MFKGDIIRMTSYGVQSYKIRLQEASDIVNTMLSESTNTTLILEKVLPQLSKVEDARQLVSKTLRNDKMEISKMRRELGIFL